jgi:hypothetical protein
MKVSNLLARGRRHPLFVPLSTALIVRLLTLAAALLFVEQRPVRPHPFLLHGGAPHRNALLDVMQRWDAYWFLNIARNGYRYYGVQEQSQGVVRHAETNITPFPLYPLLIWLLGGLIGDLSAAATLLSVVAYGLAMVLLHRSIANSPRGSPAVASRAIAYLSLYPAAFVFGAPYSESLFLLAAVGAFVALGRGRWVIAGLAASAASATRLAGVWLAPALALDLWRRDGYFSRRVLALGVLAGSGATAYLLYLWGLTGDPFAYFTAQQGWSKSFIAPWRGLLALFAAQPLASPLAALRVAAMALFAAALVDGWRRISAGQWLLACCWWLMPLCSSNPLGLPRYLLPSFPSFIVLAHWTEGRRRAHAFVLLSSACWQLWALRGWLAWELSL